MGKLSLIGAQLIGNPELIRPRSGRAKYNPMTIRTKNGVVDQILICAQYLSYFIAGAIDDSKRPEISCLLTNNEFGSIIS